MRLYLLHSIQKKMRILSIFTLIYLSVVRRVDATSICNISDIIKLDCRAQVMQVKILKSNHMKNNICYNTVLNTDQIHYEISLSNPSTVGTIRHCYYHNYK